MPRIKQRTPPRVGTVYRKRFNGKVYEMEVVRVDYGVGFKVQGKVFATPSASAQSVTKYEINGWKFWKID